VTKGPAIGPLIMGIGMDQRPKRVRRVGVGIKACGPRTDVKAKNNDPKWNNRTRHEPMKVDRVDGLGQCALQWQRDFESIAEIRGTNANRLER